MKNAKKIAIIFEQNIKEKQVLLLNLNQKKDYLKNKKENLNSQIVKCHNNSLISPELMVFSTNYVNNIKEKVMNIDEKIQKIDSQIVCTFEELEKAFIENKKINIYINNKIQLQRKINLNNDKKLLEQITTTYEAHR